MRGKINKEVWNKIVEKTKQEIEEILEGYNAPTFHQKIKCYLYDADGNLHKEFDTLTECAFYINSCPITLKKYLEKEYIFNGYLINNKVLTKEDAKKLYEYNKENNKEYRRNYPHTDKATAPAYIYDKEGNLIESISIRHKWAREHHKANSFAAKCDRIYKGNLISVNQYTKDEASKKWSEAYDYELQVEIKMHRKNPELFGN